MQGRYKKTQQTTTNSTTSFNCTFYCRSNANVQNAAFGNTTVTVDVDITAKGSTTYAYSYQNRFLFVIYNPGTAVLVYKTAGTPVILGSLTASPTISASVLYAPDGLLAVTVTPGDSDTNYWDIELNVRMSDGSI